MAWSPIRLPWPTQRYPRPGPLSIAAPVPVQAVPARCPAIRNPSVRPERLGRRVLFFRGRPMDGQDRPRVGLPKSEFGTTIRCAWVCRNRSSAHGDQSAFTEISGVGEWRSLVARYVRDVEAPGSNPGSPTTFFLTNPFAMRRSLFSPRINNHS